MAHIFQINVSRGGVPKLPVSRADIDDNGITLDDQADKKHHGGPLQNLCLFRLETIVGLQEEGHPIVPGAVGENITTYGLGSDAMKPGTRLRLGSEVLIELTEPAPPCSTIAAAFSDRNFNRINEKKHPGWSRMYARILQGGAIVPGDGISIESVPEA